MGPIAESSDSVWLGYFGTDLSDVVAADLADRQLIPVQIEPAEYGVYYDGYANATLWPLFHEFPERSRFDSAYFDAYIRVNRRFADAVCAIADQDDLIWIHDYHLMALPEMIRQRLPHARIGFFLHIPFPTSQSFRVLPQRAEVLEGLLGADLIGLQTYEQTENLQRSFRRVLGIESVRGELRHAGRRVRVQAHPISIDAEQMRVDAKSPEADRFLADLRHQIGDRKVVLGVDRLDYTKGLPQKIQAWERLLDDNPQWRSRAVLIQLAIPSREGITEYEQQKKQVERLVGLVNGRFGTPGRVPIHYMYRSISRDQLGAMYKLADAAMVTPLRDGMNLVAKEYVACRDQGSGVLLLSEFAGAASELGEALRINPWDVEGTAKQLGRALDMEETEQRERMVPMHERVLLHDVHQWSRGFLDSLTGSSVGPLNVPPMLRSPDLATTLSPEYDAAKNSLVFIDYDGSLREFTRRYEDASPTNEVLTTLQELGNTPSVRTYISAGRTRSEMSQWLAESPVSLIAENGGWIRENGSSDWCAVNPPLDTEWKESVLPILNEYAARTPGARIEQREAALVWHYREADASLGEWQASELVNVLGEMLSSSPADVLLGARIVEVRHSGVKLGLAFDHIWSKHGPFDFILAAGDDGSDEDLFGHLPLKAHSVKVGGGSSIATAAVSSPGSLRQMLKLLAQAKNRVSPEGTSWKDST